MSIKVISLFEFFNLQISAKVVAVESQVNILKTFNLIKFYKNVNLVLVSANNCAISASIFLLGGTRFQILQRTYKRIVGGRVLELLEFFH